MSSQVWAIEMMNKYKLKVCFYEREIDAPGGAWIGWGPNDSHKDFYSALQYMVNRIS